MDEVSCRAAGRSAPVAAAVAALVVVVAFDAVVATRAVYSGVPADFAVYRLGAAAALHGADLYAVTDPGSGLGFTYPPFAALLFAPLALLPAPAAFVVVLLLNTTLFWMAWRLVRAVVPMTRTAARVLFTLGWLCEPVASTIAAGQVNLLLAVLLLADVVLLRRSRAHGAGVGIAAGLKLTPALFAVALLATGRRRAAAVAGLAFAGTVLLGALAVPGGSWWYWTRGMLRTDRVGVESVVDNQSLAGVVARLTGEPQVPGVPVVLLGLAVVLACLPLLRGLHATGRELGLFAACGVLAQLVSPIAWSHHWVFLPLLALCVLPLRERPVLAGLAVLVIDLRWLSEQLGSPGWQHSWPAAVLSAAFPLLAAALLAVVALQVRRPVRSLRWHDAGELDFGNGVHRVVPGHDHP